MEKELPVAKPGMTKEEFLNKWATYEGSYYPLNHEIGADLDKVIQSEMAQPGEPIYQKCDCDNGMVAYSIGNEIKSVFCSRCNMKGFVKVLPAQQSWPSEEEIRKYLFDTYSLDAYSIEVRVKLYFDFVNWLKSRQQKGE